MKELSIEQKAKAYDEALEKARIWKDKSGIPKDRQGILDDIFPELAEGEDEIISKELIDFVKSRLAGFSQCEKFIAWIEKQGEKPHGKSALKATKEEKVDNQNCAKPTDKVEPKFKVGDWIINTESGYIRQILKINNGCYKTDYGILPIKDYESIFRLWTIQNAKEGDVLALFYASQNYILIYKGLYEKSFKTIMSVFCFYCVEEDTYYDETDNFHVMNSGEIITPSTKEQRNLLFQKMKEAGYEWDADKKELKKIEQKPAENSAKVSESSTEEKDMGEYKKGFECGKQRVLKYPEDFGLSKKSTWSEERFNSIIESYKDLLKDYKACHDVDYIPYNSDTVIRNVVDDVNFLKSLKDRYTWKPSDEQMGVIEAVINNRSFQRRHLDSLYEQLKKLREE